MKARFASVVLLGFVLIAAAACGGSDGLTTAEEKELQDRLAAAEAAEAEAERLRREAEAAEAQAEADRKAAEEAREAEEQARLEAERKAAEEEEARKQAEQKAAEEEEARKEAEREAAEAEAERERQAAAAAEAERQRQAEAEAEAERQRQAALQQQQQEQIEQQLAKAQRAELRARASLFGPQLDLGDGTTGPAAPTTVSGSADVSWTRGNTLTFRPEGTLDPGSAAPSVPGGWRSAGFTGHAGSAATLTNETVYLYTNIQAPGTRAFWKRYGLDEAMSAGLVPLARGSSAQARTVIQNNTTTDVTEITVSGSFDGAGGTFTCDTACETTDLGGGDRATSAEINAHVATHVTFSQGRPTFVAPGNWTFKPGSITSGVPLDEDDAFLYFGVWSSISDNITGTYDFRYIAGGGAASGAGLTNFDQLIGPATFRGGAVGKYTTQGQVGGQNAKIGTFTATATLNADFDDGTNAGTLSGSITDFREDGSPLAGWRVTLGSAADVGVASTIADAAATGSTVANVGGLSVGGSWGATFHGSDNQQLADRTMYPVAQYPPVDLAGVTGWFDAVGPGTGGGPNDVAIAGAFGATRQ